jgi:hypothetical protein
VCPDAASSTMDSHVGPAGRSGMTFRSTLLH